MKEVKNGADIHQCLLQALALGQGHHLQLAREGHPSGAPTHGGATLEPKLSFIGCAGGVAAVLLEETEITVCSARIITNQTRLLLIVGGVHTEFVSCSQILNHLLLANAPELILFHCYLCLPSGTQKGQGLLRTCIPLGHLIFDDSTQV